MRRLLFIPATFYVLGAFAYGMAFLLIRWLMLCVAAGKITYTSNPSLLTIGIIVGLVIFGWAFMAMGNMTRVEPHPCPDCMCAVNRAEMKLPMARRPRRWPLGPRLSKWLAQRSRR